MIVTRTPFRVSFFGGGTDYPDWFRENGGSVLTTSIDKYCYLTVRHLPPFFEHRHRIVYSTVEMVNELGDIKHPVVRAVLQDRGQDQGLEIHHDGDLPARSGLGSSSSFAVGLVHALAALDGRMSSKMHLASEAMRIEQHVLKEVVGCQDQIATAFGGFNRINFLKNGNFDVEPIVVDRSRVLELENSLMLFFTGLTRTASVIAEETVRNLPAKRAELTAMQQMVDEAMSVLGVGKGIATEFGRLLGEAWKMKRGLAKNVSTPRIDEIYEAALAGGALGGKLLGAGGGGFMLFVVPPEKRNAVRERLKDLVHVDFRFESGGSKVLVFEINSRHD